MRHATNYSKGPEARRERTKVARKLARRPRRIDDAQLCVTLCRLPFRGPPGGPLSWTKVKKRSTRRPKMSHYIFRPHGDSLCVQAFDAGRSAWSGLEECLVKACAELISIISPYVFAGRVAGSFAVATPVQLVIARFQ